MESLSRIEKVVALGAATMSIALGCAEPTSAPPVIETALSGRLCAGFGDQPRQVDVHDWTNGRRGDLLCTTETEGNRSWSCDVGPFADEVLVRVRVDDTTFVEALVDDVALGQGRASVQVSPVTHLVTAYAEQLLEAGLTSDAALAKSRRLLHAHFGRLDHGRLAPEDLLVTNPSRVTDAVVVGVLLVGFDALAAELAAANNETLLTPWVLMSALARDIRADGVFDGQGDEGPVRASTVQLDGFTLRTDYGRAILSWLRSDANTTGLVAEDFAALADAIGANRSEIFPDEEAPPVDDEGPMVTYFEFRTERDGDVIDTSRPLRGSWHVEARAEDRSGVEAFAVEVVEVPDFVFGARIVDDNNYKRWPFDSAELPVDGPVSIRLTVTDALGNTTVVDKPFVADNTPPVSTFSAAGVVATGTVRVVGTSTDAVGPIESIVIRGGDGRVDVEDPETGTFDVELDIPCGAIVPVRVLATDAAGNTGTDIMDVRCDDVPPTLSVQPTVYRQESDLEVVYAADGSSVSYQWTTDLTEVTLDDSGAPIALAKYLTRFDDFAANLPRLVWVANDAAGTHVSAYRYLVNGTEHRPWTEVTPVNVVPGQSLYELALSYQSLSARLGEGREADVHRVELRAVDEAGNVTTRAVELNVELLSPPVWIGGCALSPGLSQFTLAGRTLRDAYQRPTGAPLVDLLSAQMRYGLDAPGGISMMPLGPVRVQFEAEVTSRITELTEDLHYGPQFVPGGLGDVCPAPSHRRMNAMGAWSAACVAGVKPTVDVLWARASDGAVNDETPIEPDVVVRSPTNSPVLPNTSGEFPVSGAERYLLFTVLPATSAVRFGGVAYDWSEAITVPAGYTLTQQVPRYRLLAYNGQGVDFITNNDPVDYPRWVSRAYISAFEIESAPIVAEARHESLVDLEVDVVLAPECEAALVYQTSL
ncbi:MAG: hypothetical protein RLO06_14845 [Parvibaculum sp.]